MTAKLDLLVVGMFERDAANQPIGGARRLDHVLHGTLGRLREGGIFKGISGETMMLTTPPAPIQARALMLVGMGASLSPTYPVFGHPAELAMRAALRMRVQSAGCLLAWLEGETPADIVEASAAIMIQGAVRAIDEAESPAEGHILEWTFFVQQDGDRRTEAAFRRAFDSLP
ncbi:peptidase M17 [Sphingomonas sp. QA11]|uniref:M17 family peptidase N-terminal domain-containing protein n=1 Tax=Sphingomonas sp. QA11 TaxID=2950605 RepID=UPI00234A8E5D|nr:M17 family peptidase N-terminal domain-containing protein [Sphingomonas sp. QA11]WCM28625.1 peptidase M17 [Sphingomonas sp. QA11]